MFYNLKKSVHSKPNHKICSYAKIGYGLNTLNVIKGSEIKTKLNKEIVVVI